MNGIAEMDASALQPEAAPNALDAATAGASKTFTIRVEQIPYLTIIREQPVYMSACHDYYPWETLSAAGWGPLRNELPSNPADPIYLNGTFRARSAPIPHPTDPAACTCFRLVRGKILGSPQEYVRVGSMHPPDAGPAAAQVPMIELRDVTTPLRARIKYFDEPECKTERVDLVTPQ